MIEPLSATYRRARKFRRQIMLRNLLELAVGGWLVAWFGEQVLDGALPAVVRIGAALLVVGVVVLALNLVRRTWVGPVPPPGLQVPIWYRGQLARQRAALLDVPRWYLGPLVPGLVVTALARGLLGGTFLLAVASVTFAVVAWLNRRAARRLERELSAVS